ncbi:hypothetical protein VP142E351_P0065 [Vibrio phage 142E35-1]|nr:hypothetical protein VP142E351_P0065 [Vibrio phage 142E35-1]
MVSYITHNIYLYLVVSALLPNRRIDIKSLYL